MRILLADDQKMMRDGLRALLEKEPGMDIVGEASTGHEVLALSPRVRPDVVVMDVTMPELNGVETTRRLLAQESAVKVVALSVHTDRRYMAAMLEAGAVAYVPKNVAFDELAQAIHVASRGQRYLSPAVTGGVIEGYLRKESAGRTMLKTTLTPREREVLQLLAEGHSSKDIAQKLTLSVATVESHRRQIGAKLDIHSVAELTKFAIREGLTSLED
ncbi:MAG: response regulator transcription factor [Byssovorax sp.]